MSTEQTAQAIGFRLQFGLAIVARVTQFAEFRELRVDSVESRDDLRFAVLDLFQHDQCPSILLDIICRGVACFAGELDQVFGQFGRVFSIVSNADPGIR